MTEFTDIAIVGSLDGKKNTLVTGPCGVCRQALYEFCGPRLRVLMAKSGADYIDPGRPAALRLWPDQS